MLPLFSTAYENGHFENGKHLNFLPIFKIPPSYVVAKENLAYLKYEAIKDLLNFV